MKAKIFKVAFSIVLTMLVSIGFAQTWPPTNVNWVANEDLVLEVDSVTLGAIMRYWVEPDPDLNATYTANAIGTTDEANLLSYWDWGFVNAVEGSDVTVTVPNSGAGGTLDSTWNYIDVTFVTAGAVPANDIEIQTIENSTPTYGTSCGGGNTSSAFVYVMTEPAGSFTAGPNANFQLSYCVAGVGGTATPVLPVTYTSNRRGITFTYDIVDETDGSADAIDLTVDPVGSDITLGALGIGDYEFTLTAITDAVSEKCNGNGLGNSFAGNVSANPVFNVTISKTPVTGKIYHIAN